MKNNILSSENSDEQLNPKSPQEKTISTRRDPWMLTAKEELYAKVRREIQEEESRRGESEDEIKNTG